MVSDPVERRTKNSKLSYVFGTFTFDKYFLEWNVALLTLVFTLPRVSY